MQLLESNEIIVVKQICDSNVDTVTDWKTFADKSKTEKTETNDPE